MRKPNLELTKLKHAKTTIQLATLRQQRDALAEKLQFVSDRINTKEQELVEIDTVLNSKFDTVNPAVSE